MTENSNVNGGASTEVPGGKYKYNKNWKRVYPITFAVKNKNHKILGLPNGR